MAMLLQAMFLALLAAMLVRSVRFNHALIGAAGVVGLVYGWAQHGAAGLLAPLAVVIVALIQGISRLLADRRARFSSDEESMLAAPLAGLSRARARHFLDQGLWLHGHAGEVLSREGEPAAHLYYLASGTAEVVSGGRKVGFCRAGQLIGEATVLSPDAATATVTLTEPSRFWCAPAKTLRVYLSANDDVRHVLERGFTMSLREKLNAMNKASGV